MKTFIKYSLSLSIVLVVWACSKDFVTKDIKNEVMTIISPNDNLATNNNTVLFWWAEVDGAEKYNLQIVKPSFDSIQQLLVDTNVVGVKFTHTFTPGRYQWRIRAVNNAGNTVFITRNIIIDTTSNLANITVGSMFPNDNYLTGSKAIIFSWTPVNAATYYELEVKNSVGTQIINPNNISSTSYSYTFANTTDVVYNWRVKAHNQSTSSNFNAARTFTIDVTAPSASSIIYPGYGVTVVGSTDSLKWSRGISADTKSDSIVISLDSNFTTYIRSVKTYNTKLKLSQLNPVLSISAGGNNYYWWRIISMDSVKNLSSPSPKYKFKVN